MRTAFHGKEAKRYNGPANFL